jgi:phosphoglucosamine mutase
MKYFGTDGIRGAYGSENMNEAFAQKVGMAVGYFLNEQGMSSPNVALGCDTRPSSPSLKEALINGLKVSGARVIDFDVVPTPALAFGVIKHQLNFGVMITASHNPYKDNGIKFFNGDGTKLNLQQEVLLESFIGMERPHKQADDTCESRPILDEYLKNIKSHFSELNLSGLQIALDSANGATCKSTMTMLEDLGADVSAIHQGTGLINNECGSENLESLISLVQREKLHLGIAHDGDGDRVCFVNHQGSKIDGDQILGLLALHAYRNNELESSTFVSTIHSNFGLHSSLNKEGIHSITADVGDRNVYQKMLDNNSSLGGESSGHIIFRDYLPTGDGLFAALSVLQAMNRSAQSLDSLSNEINLLPSKSGSFFVASKLPLDQIPSLNQELEICQNHLGEKGRVLIRYSGTEPKIRLLVEGPSTTIMEECFEQLRSVLQKAL